MAFEEGDNHNPRGRGVPAYSEGQLRRRVAALSRQFTEEAVEEQVAIMRDKDVSAATRLACTIAILDRGWGRPTQAVSVHHEDDQDAGDTDEQEFIPVLAGIFEEIQLIEAAEDNEVAGEERSLLSAEIPPSSKRH